MSRFEASILLPVHSTRFLLETLTSIDVACKNEFDWQLVIILDRVPLRELQSQIPNLGANISLTILESKKPGIVNALNLGLSQCKSALIARIDEDDLVSPNRFISQVEYLKKNPECLVVGSALQLIDEEGNKIGNIRYPLQHRNLTKSLFLFSPIAHPASMYRLDAVEGVGGYRLGVPEDWDLWVRLSRIGKIRNLPEKLISYRQHNNQLSRTKMYKLWRSRRILLVANFLNDEDFARELHKFNENDSALSFAVSELVQQNRGALREFHRILNQESFEELRNNVTTKKTAKIFRLIKFMCCYPSQSFRAISLKFLALK